MIDVVLPVAIHRRSLDVAVAKVYILSQMRAALLAAQMRVASARTFCLACQLTPAIVPSASPLFCHRLALVHVPRQFVLLILQQRIVIRCHLHWQARRHHRHHPLCVETNLPARHPPEQFPKFRVQLGCSALNFRIAGPRWHRSCVNSLTALPIDKNLCSGVCSLTSACLKPFFPD